MKPVADLGILEEGFSRLVGTEPRSGDQSAQSAENIFQVFFLAIRKRSRSISAHSGHIPRRKDD